MVGQDTVVGNFTSHSGGNKVDGLLPASSLFLTIIFLIHTYGYCASGGEGFIEFGGQDVENGRGQVS